jgi:hypothetical protein
MPAELILHRLRTTQVDVEPDVRLIVLSSILTLTESKGRLKIHISGLPGRNFCQAVEGGSLFFHQLSH